MKLSNYIIATYDTEKDIHSAMEMLGKSKIKVHDVFSPYPLHHIDNALGIKRSRLPIICFIAGTVGFLLGLGFQMWVFKLSWPIIVGGKPYNSVPAFIPVTFELTVLIGGLATVAAFFIRNKLFPMKKAVMQHLGITNHRFALAISNNDASLDLDVVYKILKEGNVKTIEEEELCL